MIGEIQSVRGAGSRRSTEAPGESALLQPQPEGSGRPAPRIDGAHDRSSAASALRNVK